jgi:hypothetical protein
MFLASPALGLQNRSTIFQPAAGRFRPHGKIGLKVTAALSR